jgi:membrane-associated phospholipid phosphatase
MRTCALVVAFALWGVSARAQESQPPADASTQQSQPGGKKVAAGEEATKPDRGFAGTLLHNLGDDLKHIPRRNSLYWLAAGSAMTAGIHPADDYINEHLSGSDFADAFFAPAKYIGSFPVMLGASFTTYLVGRTRHVGWVQHLGMDLIEATLLSEGITQGLKVAIRRDRPLRDDGTRASGFSFPSGHAAVTFATATVLQQHLGLRQRRHGRRHRRHHHWTIGHVSRAELLRVPHAGTRWRWHQRDGDEVDSSRAGVQAERYLAIVWCRATKGDAAM